MFINASVCLIGLVWRLRPAIRRLIPDLKRITARQWLALLLIVVARVEGASVSREGYFNGSSEVRIQTSLDLRGHTGLSFRTCRGGELFSKTTSNGNFISLLVKVDEGLLLKVRLHTGREYNVQLSARLVDNAWHAVNLKYSQGNISLGVATHSTVVANSTYNTELMTNPELFSENSTLYIGKGFIGCILEGPNIVFNRPGLEAYNVDWGQCPLNTRGCTIADHCSTEPCMQHGECISLSEKYECHCYPRYSGKNCETDNGPTCERNGTSPCKNGGTCQERNFGNYNCICDSFHTGKHCEIEINSETCEVNPCKNNGTCRVENNINKCTCPPGYTGDTCATNIDECESHPCQNGGLCQDHVNNYTCLCAGTGYKGYNCEQNINECEENSPCLNGKCFDNYGGYTCQCFPGFGGQNCEMNSTECSSGPCRNGGRCTNIPGSYICDCSPGYTGRDCDVAIMSCDQVTCPPNSICTPLQDGFQCVCKPGYQGRDCSTLSACTNTTCLNGGVCSSAKDQYCVCPQGYAGIICQNLLDECSSRCLNGGVCVMQRPGTYICNCTKDFTGPFCEREIDSCASYPCQNNGTCIKTTRYIEPGLGYFCQCLPGFTGFNCETYKSDCPLYCPDNMICVNTPSGPECRCQEGYSGPQCLEMNVVQCRENSPNCLHGICRSAATPGSHQCYCQPGYSGIHCDIDFDECLSQPCRNGATCENKINDFRCSCPPGYTGKDCSIEINECSSNPCKFGATCLDKIGYYTCSCPPGLTGTHCETDIDDCESRPCLNSGRCEDKLNGYVCHCNGTGFEGKLCEMNVDDCYSNPCMHGGLCKDKINDFECECNPGFLGKRCDQDFDECASMPCQNNGTCLENSKIESYRNPDYPYQSQLNYSNASGYRCICAPGTSGENCEINHNDCESNPCMNGGTCEDQINAYLCECTDGFEGVRCENDIDECERYHPCGEHGKCIDREADYKCDCDPLYGGKNCSVRLTGCREDSCHNNGTCTPYLVNEIEHKFNCSCPRGFHGDTCEVVTTMSISDKSRVQVVTRRDEGYDFHFRFKTTLPDCLLAIGKGPTYYSLELYKGRLNLHSSLLNKWEGVFIGSDLANGSRWQKVFVQINSSHVVLAANEEQTIHPINLNEGTNISYTSFPTTYLGTAIPELRSIAHGPTRFVGCMEDVVVNGEWVIWDNMPPNSTIEGVTPGCPREEQCDPNPCKNGGICTDQWSDFKCACERPYLGHTCQYNVTAATFGHENETNSIVTVKVNDMARRAIRSIMDISMFIQTRQERGAIFYMTSQTGNGNENINNGNMNSGSDETVIAAQIEGGELFVRILLNGTIEPYTVGIKLADGNSHLIQVVRNVTLVQVKINGTEYFRKTISAMGHLDVQRLYLGAFPNPSPRSVRQANEPTLSSSIRCDVNFKGVIQDVQVTNGSRIMVVEFFPLNVSGLDIPPPFGEVSFIPGTILEGVVSDDTCRSNPCQHDGNCTVTWNDFICKCRRGHKGKTCQEMEYCVLEECPTGSECRNLENGYECVANITFSGQNSSLNYLLKRPQTHYSVHESSLDSISIKYRTLAGGTLLYISSVINVSEFFSVSALHDEVTLAWNLQGDSDILRIRRNTDGNWATILFNMENDEIIGRFDGASEEDTEAFSTRNFSLNAWKLLLINGRISVGTGHLFNPYHNRLGYFTVSADAATPLPDLSPIENSVMELSHNYVNEVPFRGCLGEVRIGGLLLPYYTSAALGSNNLTVQEYFSLEVPSSQRESFALELSCVLCFNAYCENQGTCMNATESYRCKCLPGFDGLHCEKNIDECLLESQCKNNSTCVDQIANYTCSCLPGFEGWLCDVNVNECESDPCQNQGTCNDLIGSFECICPEEYTGTFCEQRKLLTCADSPCRNNSTCSNTKNTRTGHNFTCNCARGYEGTFCENVYCVRSPCLNGGSCIIENAFCSCLFGYTGELCQTDIDDCESQPCKHGGICEDFVGNYTCSCEGTGYEGVNCETDIDECKKDEQPCIDGECVNKEGSYYCKCSNGFCGKNCNISNPCHERNPCENGADCIPSCKSGSDYDCKCTDGFGGKNCSEPMEGAYLGSSFNDVIIIVGPIIGILLIVLIIGLSVFISMARKKRATRGTYSPSQQEYCNPRVELDNVMKPPPEERLI
ncbi:protein crumbs [Anabrus simplex]|uniref:protein crumbs n=1 Tax=Anabrus simplex TaxID=316456 RepID=UPI0035A3145F